MKSFRYTAQNEQGEKVSGSIESLGFDDALEKIRTQGLQVMAIEEGKFERELVQEMRPFVFEAIDPSGDEVQGTVKGVDAASIAQHLEDELGLEITELYQEGREEKDHHEVQVQDLDHTQNNHQDYVSHEREPEGHDSSHETKEIKVLQEEEAIEVKKEEKEEVKEEYEKKEESILFDRKATIDQQKKDAGGDELGELEHEIQALLSEKGELLSEVTRESLEHVSGKIDLLRESPNKKRLKNLKREFKRVKRSAEKDIEKHENKKWDEYEKKAPKNHVESYEEFEEGDEGPKKTPEMSPSKRSWIHIIDEPDEENQQEVLMKQQYESVWIEAQRFSGVLFAFYLLTLFVAYYLKRVGVEDQFLVRIYDTTLFKQITVILFAVFVLLTLRKDFLPKKVQSDVAMLLVGLITAFMVFS